VPAVTRPTTTAAAASLATRMNRSPSGPACQPLPLALAADKTPHNLIESTTIRR
jgi:hypothetical protein